MNCLHDSRICNDKIANLSKWSQHMQLTGSTTVVLLVKIVHKYFILAIVFSYIAVAFLPQFGLWIRDVDLSAFLAPQNKMNLTLPPLMLATLLFNAA